MNGLWMFLVLQLVVEGFNSIKPYSGGGCLPGELVLVDCNLCTCDKHGRPNLICAKMWCFPQNPKTIPPSVVGPAHETFGEGDEESLEDTDTIGEAAAAAAEASDVILAGENGTKIIVNQDDDKNQRMDEVILDKKRRLVAIN